MACVNLPVFSQGRMQVLDSMKMALTRNQPDTERIATMNGIAAGYFTIAPEQGIQYAEKAKTLAEKIGWKKGLVSAYRSLGTNYWALKDFLKAQDNFWAALKISEQINDLREIATSIHSLGVLYNSNDDNSKAIDCFSRASFIYQKIKDTAKAAGCFSNMASMYESLGKTDSSLFYYHKALELAGYQKKSYPIAYYQARIGTLLFRLSKLDSAIYYEKTALKTFEFLRDSINIADMTGELGNIYSAQGKTQAALSQYRKAINLLSAINGIEGLANVAKYKTAIAGIYLKQADQPGNQSISKRFLESAEKYLLSSILLADASHYIEGQSTDYLLLSQVYEKLQQPLNALNAYKKHVLLKDSLSNSLRINEMARHEMAYGFEKQKDSLEYIRKLERVGLENTVQEKELESFRFKQKWALTITGAIFLVVVAVIYLLFLRMKGLKYRNQLLNQKTQERLKEIAFEKKLREANISAIRAQLNPHFMFNSLNAIQELILKNENEKSQSYLERFAQLLRMILENADQPFIPLCKEIEFSKLYLSLEKLRIPDLEYSFDVDPGIDPKKIQVPNMMLQPYIENALWHGLQNKTGDKKLEVTVTKGINRVNYQVKDNGIGRKKASELRSVYHKEHNPKGMELLNKRFNLLSREFGEDITSHVADISENGQSKGTAVTISVPEFLSNQHE